MNKQQIVEILHSHTDGLRIGEREWIYGKVADEIMALDKEEWCPCGMPVSICGGPDDTYDKLSDLDSEKFPVRVEERPGGRTYWPVEPKEIPYTITETGLQYSIHEDDCKCRQCRPDMWFQQGGVWTKKI